MKQPSLNVILHLADLVLRWTFQANLKLEGEPLKGIFQLDMFKAKRYLNILDHFKML